MDSDAAAVDDECSRNVVVRDCVVTSKATMQMMSGTELRRATKRYPISPS